MLIIILLWSLFDCSDNTVTLNVHRCRRSLPLSDSLERNARSLPPKAKEGQGRKEASQVSNRMVSMIFSQQSLGFPASEELPTWHISPHREYLGWSALLELEWWTRSTGVISWLLGYFDSFGIVFAIKIRSGTQNRRWQTWQCRTTLLPGPPCRCYHQTGSPSDLEKFTSTSKNKWVGEPD